MTAQIDPKYIFLESEDHFFVIFFHIRHPDLIFFLFFITYQVKQTHLTGKRIFLFLCNTVHDLTVNKHFLTAVAFQTVQCTGFDKVFDCTLVDRSCQSLDKILQRTILALYFSFFYQRIDDRAAHTLDCRKPITNRAIIHRKSICTSVDIRRKDLNIHLPTYLNIFCHFCRHFNHRCHKRSHKFHRIVIFQKRCLIRNDCISCCMGFIKCIFCKINHIIIDLVCSLLGNPVCNTSRNSLGLISINKILAFLLHHSCLLFSHCTAHKIASSKRVSGKAHYNLHNLFLINNTAVSRCKNFF